MVLELVLADKVEVLAESLEQVEVWFRELPYQIAHAIEPVCVLVHSCARELRQTKRA